jgi:hypothetical protein
MKTEISICKGCKLPKRIENRTHGLCHDCNVARKEAHVSFLGLSHNETNKPTTSTSAFVKSLKKGQNPTGEALLFDTIWKTRPHVSYISDKPINIIPHSDLWYNCFLHVLPKGKYPGFRLLDINIVLGLPEEHLLYDQGTEDQRKKYAKQCENEGGGCDWDKLYALAENLKLEYKYRG